MKYDDEYNTCKETFASLAFFHKELKPRDLDELLGIKSTDSHECGDPISKKHPEKSSFKEGTWILSSEGIIDSKDSRRHIDWLLNQIESKSEVVKDLVSKDYYIRIFCYWVSAHGHGGPTVSPEQSKRLGDLGIELCFDNYFNDEG